MLGLTEHVITSDISQDPCFASSPRCIEVIRALNYPEDLIIKTKNYQAAIEFVGVSENSVPIAHMFLDYDHLATYIADYPTCVANILKSNHIHFVAYIMIVGTDPRYVDFLDDFQNNVIAAHLARMPEQSLNHHLVDPSIDILVRIAQKIRDDPNIYVVKKYNDQVYFAYSKCQVINKKYYRWCIFANNVHRFVNSQTDMCRFVKAAFSDMHDAREWTRKNAEFRSKQIIDTVNQAIDML